MEAAMSTKHTLKLSSMLQSIVSLCDFFVHPLQLKLRSIKHEEVRPLKRVRASCINISAQHLLFLLLLFNLFSINTYLKETCISLRVGDLLDGWMLQRKFYLMI